MRRLGVLICLLGLMLNGCAAQHTAFVPTGIDSEQLTAAIAEHGQGTPSQPIPSFEAPAQPQTRLDRTVQVSMEATPYVLGGIILAPLVVLWALARGQHGPVDFSGLKDLDI